MAFSFFSGLCSQETSMWYNMIRNVVHVIFRGTLLKTDYSCSVDPKMHPPAKRSLAMREHTGGVLRDFIVANHRDICREHSLIGLRNCLMTESANSPSATTAPEVSITSNRQSSFGLGHSRTCVASRLRSVAPQRLSR